jgi:hypothetical protein
MSAEREIRQSFGRYVVLQRAVGFEGEEGVERERAIG